MESDTFFCHRNKRNHVTGNSTPAVSYISVHTILIKSSNFPQYLQLIYVCKLLAFVSTLVLGSDCVSASD